LRQTSPRCRVKARMGTLETLGDEEKFDTILYIDVLEHIADDLGELRHAATHLAPEGHLVVLSPAHPFLFSPFDTALGHYRRYTLASLIAVSPGSLKPVRLAYLDSAGLLASLANRLLLAQSIPRLSQILFWDRFLVRISKFMDPLLRHSLGKSVLGIWKRC